MLLKDVLVLKLDGVPDDVGDVIDPDGLSVEEGDAPVQFGFLGGAEDLLGHARLRKLDKEVRADITLFEHLSLETLDALLDTTPAVGGVVLQRQREFPGFIERALVRRLGLSHSPNADKRIGSLRAQGYSIEAKVDPGLSDAKFEVDVHQGRVPAPPRVLKRRARRPPPGRRAPEPRAGAAQS
jgi:hypothetical protein